MKGVGRLKAIEDETEIGTGRKMLVGDAVMIEIRHRWKKTLA